MGKDKGVYTSYGWKVTCWMWFRAGLAQGYGSGMARLEKHVKVRFPKVILNSEVVHVPSKVPTCVICVS